jgi:hypothetical protein
MKDKQYIINRNLINDYLINNIRIPDNILYFIIGEKNHDWWCELAQNKPFLKHIDSTSLSYGVFDADLSSNIISFCHDYLNHSFNAFFVDIHINYDFSDIDHIIFKNFFDKHQLKMHDNELLFYQWLQKPIDVKEEECASDDFFERFGEG